MKLLRGCLLVGLVGMVGASFAGVPFFRNWDFERGNVGFTNDLQHKPEWMYDEGAYVVDSNPRAYHRDWHQMSDHTLGDGTGKMLMVNGSVVADKPFVWMQVLDGIQTGTNYEFSVFAAALMGARKSQLVFTVDDVEIGGAFEGGDNGQWTQAKAVFNSGNRTSVRLGIKNRITEPNGNDFALDDINVQLAAVPEPATLAALGLGMIALVRVRRKSS